MTKELSGVVAEHIRAVNAFDIDAIVATFAEDARLRIEGGQMCSSNRILI